MAEFLVFNKEHWTKTAPLSARTTHEQLKFAAVHEMGDIVEVRPDGYWKERKHDTKVFRVIKKPLLDYEKYKCLMESVDRQFPDANGKIYLQYRRRGEVDSSNNVTDKLGMI